MKKGILFIVALVLLHVVQAQFILRLVVDNVATKKLDDIYVAGSFNNWNPSDPNYKLKPFGNNRKASPAFLQLFETGKDVVVDSPGVVGGKRIVKGGEQGFSRQG